MSVICEQLKAQADIRVLQGDGLESSCWRPHPVCTRGPQLLTRAHAHTHRNLTHIYICPQMHHMQRQVGFTRGSHTPLIKKTRGLLLACVCVACYRLCPQISLFHSSLDKSHSTSINTQRTADLHLHHPTPPLHYALSSSVPSPLPP